MDNKPMIKRLAWMGMLVITTGLTSTARAAPQASSASVEPAATQPGSTRPADANGPVDAILRQLQQVGTGLRSFTAKVQLTETDALTADEFSRTGSVVYQVLHKGDARLVVRFDRKVVADRSQEHRVDYLLSDGWLLERDYRTKTEVRRQVLRPGQRVDLLKLGEGPFPLPIGQEVAQVHKLFLVTPLTNDASQEPAPPDTDALRLTPRPGSQFAGKFQSIDVWVDRTSHMPVRIQTLDAGGNVLRTTDLTDLRVNADISDKQFDLPPVDASWNRHEEPFKE